MTQVIGIRKMDLIGEKRIKSEDSQITGSI